MVEAALEQMEKIPETERGSVALIVAKSEWNMLVVDYLRSHDYDFSVLEGKPLYQLHHVDRVLVFLRLIGNSKQDDDVERLLRYCVVPYFDNLQVKTLRNSAQAAGCSLFELLSDNRAFKKAHITEEQQTALQRHLTLIANFSPTSLVDQLVEALRSLDDGPIVVIAEQEQKAEELETVLKILQQKTVIEALAEVKQHLSFLEGGQRHTGLIATTIDNAKSEEFDTVFLLGADYLPKSAYSGASLTYKRRLYVSISRARRRLYLVVNGERQALNPLLSSIPKYLYSEIRYQSISL